MDNPFKINLFEKLPNSQSTTTGTTASTNSVASVFDDVLKSTLKITKTNVSSAAGTTSILGALNKTLYENNKTDSSQSTIHGMSEQEYRDYQKFVYEQYGITTDDHYNEYNKTNDPTDRWSVAEAMANACNDGNTFKAMEKVAQSCDSILDLVLDAKLDDYINNVCGGKIPDWDDLENSSRLLNEYGIKVTKDNNLYSFSLVDDNGNVIQDEDGHLAQVYKTDMLMPDGLTQNNEIHIAEALDAMGFDCMSALDLSPEDYELVKQMAQIENSQLGTSSNINGSNAAQIRVAVIGVHDERTGRFSKVRAQDNSAWTNGTYVDKYTGETTGRRKYWSGAELANRAAYRGQKGNSQSYGRNLGMGSSGSTGSTSGSSGSGGVSRGGAVSDREVDSSSKIAVSLVEFNKIVRGLIKEKHCSQSEALTIASEKYMVKGIADIKQYYEAKVAKEAAEDQTA